MIGSSERGSSIVKRNSLCLLALVQEMQVLKKGGGGGGKEKGLSIYQKASTCFPNATIDEHRSIWCFRAY